MSNLAIDKFDNRRFGLITGSACSVLFPDKGNGAAGQTTYAKELAMQKYFQYYDEVSDWKMQHGDMNEHEGFTYYQINYDITIEKGWFMMEGEWGGTSDAEAQQYGADLKCPTTLHKFLEYIHTGIDKQQWNQAQMYMFLSKKPAWKVLVYLTETQWMVERDLKYPVPEDKRMIVIDVAKDETWEARLRAATPFVIEERERYHEILCQQFGSKTPPPPPKADHTETIAKIKELKKKTNI